MWIRLPLEIQSTIKGWMFQAPVLLNSHGYSVTTQWYHIAVPITRKTAFACGQLIAMIEHRTLVTAWLRGTDPFTTAKSSSLQVEQQRKEQLTTKLQQIHNDEQVEEDQVNSSTMTILKLIS